MPMNGIQVLLVVVAVDAFVLGAAFLAIWQLNRAVSRTDG
jgi:hypothetical protein